MSRKDFKGAGLPGGNVGKWSISEHREGGRERGKVLKEESVVGPGRGVIKQRKEERREDSDSAAHREGVVAILRHVHW